jgi:hypothetical protein
MSISDSPRQLSLEEEVKELREKVEALEKKTFSPDEIIKLVERSIQVGLLRRSIKSALF